MHTFEWVDHLARIEEFFSASDHDRDYIHVLIGQKITTDRVMNNSASNNSSTQPSEERRKKVWKAGHKQEIVDELVACGKDSTNTSYSGSIVYLHKTKSSRLLLGETLRHHSVLHFKKSLW